MTASRRSPPGSPLATRATAPNPARPTAAGRIIDGFRVRHRRCGSLGARVRLARWASADRLVVAGPLDCVPLGIIHVERAPADPGMLRGRQPNAQALQPGLLRLVVGEV